jgi:predicted nucleotidyltransferase component of viral defense system
MIPQTAITAWRKIANWGSSDQVEHDLVLSRAICELYTHPVICEQLVFRGGTALHKLFFEHYMHKDNATISRLDFENNLFNKKSDIVFNRDIQPLLSVDQRARYDHEKAYEIVLNKFIILNSAVES